ncbi:Phosphotransferase enzyme family protein [Rubripirellula tenax]|uniref:Phosphotransferase enzyme family protein n=1 Tax=Rubripirellula tenax TaxID=2528015 RepID=A0A5C6ELR8_9BACT|nr:aminoglycoside phosphotransferase family protein [Rubripirellula tenax]TWU48541.1 Phosphotransferase enzyme family protein [Rubripirellula tenax]
MDSPIPADVHRWVNQVHRIDWAKAVPAGFSGGVVYDCRAGSVDRFALKMWPAGTSRTRVDEVHAIVRMARQNGCPYVPETIATATIGGRQWELATWMPGDVAADDATVETIQLGAAAIARFHRSVVSAGLASQLSSPLSSQVSKAVTSRIERLASLRHEVPQVLTVVDRGVPELPHRLAVAVDRAVQKLRSGWLAASGRIAARLSDFEKRPVPSQVVLCDVHREHVLFADGGVSGLIDFDAVRLDSPATDLARWIGGFLVHRDRESRNEVWEAGMAGFREENVLNGKLATDMDDISFLALARALHNATMWIGLANWLTWIVLENRSFHADILRIAERIDVLTELADSDEPPWGHSLR